LRGERKILSMILYSKELRLRRKTFFDFEDAGMKLAFNNIRERGC